MADMDFGADPFAAKTSGSVPGVAPEMPSPEGEIDFGLDPFAGAEPAKAPRSQYMTGGLTKLQSFADAAAVFANAPEYKLQPPEVQRQMMANFSQSFAAQHPQKKMFDQKEVQRSVMGIGGTAQQRAAQREPAIEYIQGEMPHRGFGEKEYWTQNVPRSLVRGGVKAAELAPLVLGGTPAFLGYAGTQAVGAAADQLLGSPEEGISGALSAGGANIKEQASGLWHMATDWANVFQKAPQASIDAAGGVDNLWSAVQSGDTDTLWKFLKSTNASYAFDSPGEAGIDAAFAVHAAKAGGKSLYQTVKNSPKAYAQAKTIAKKAGVAVEDVLSDPVKAMKKAEQHMRSTASRVLRPERKATFPGEMEQNVDSAIRIADDVYKWTKDETNRFLDRRDELVSGRSPQNRYELMNVFQNRMPEIWNDVTREMESAGANTTFSLQPLIDDLNTQVKAWEGNAAFEGVAEKTRKLIGSLENQQQTLGGQKLGDLNEAIQQWRKQASATFDPNNRLDNDVVKKIVDYYREAGDNLIEQATGSSKFLENRKLYSDYRRFIKNVTGDATKFLSEQTKIDQNFWDQIAVLEGLEGLLTASPKMIVLGGVTKALTMLRKKFNSPDYAIRQLFEQAKRKAYQENRLPRTEQPVSEEPVQREPGTYTPYRPGMQSPERPRESRQPGQGAPGVVYQDVPNTRVDVQAAAQRAEQIGMTPEQIREQEFNQPGVKRKNWGVTDTLQSVAPVVATGALSAYMMASDEHKQNMLAGLPIAFGLVTPRAAEMLRREGLKPDMISEGKTIFSTVRDAAGNIKRDATGAPFGYSFVQRGPKQIEVQHAAVPPELRNNEVGTSLLTEAIDRFSKNGVTVFSGDSLTEAAREIWERKLPELGYDVKQTPQGQFYVAPTGGLQGPGGGARTQQQRSAEGFGTTTPKTTAFEPESTAQGNEPKTSLGANGVDLKSFAAPVALTGAAVASMMGDKDKDSVPLLGALAFGIVGGKPFFSAAERALEKLPGESIKAQSIPNALRKMGVTEAEIKDLGLMDKIKQWGGETKIPIPEIQGFVRQRKMSLGEAVLGSGDKPTQFPGYKAIPGEADPGTYREGFVTLDNEQPLRNEQIKKYDSFEDAFADEWEPGEIAPPNARGWKDPHSQYSDINNPVGRYRYDIQTLPDGRRVMRVHEFQAAYNKSETNIPESLRERTYDLLVKKVLAEAQSQGLDGVTWSTGAQQVDLYSNALRNVADEARWNPETQELQLFKDGRRVMQKELPAKVPENQLEGIIGKAAAQRLVESEATSGGEYLDEISSRMFGKMFNQLSEADKQIIKNYKNEYYKERPDEGFKVTRDLSIDKQWPAKLYGDFENNQFNNKAKIPSLFEKYGKGKVTTLEGTKAKLPEEQVLNNERSKQELKRWVKKEYPSLSFDEIDRNEQLELAREFVGATDLLLLMDSDLPAQPVFWIEKGKTPTEFPMYTAAPFALQYFAEKGDEKIKQWLKKRRK